MNKKITSTILAALMIAGTTSFSAFAAMGNGTVVIGAKAFDLAYANDPINFTEISNAIVAGGAVYIKDFNGGWISNTTGLTVATNVIPAVVYKNATGITNFDASDTTPSTGNGTGTGTGSGTSTGTGTGTGGGGITTPVDVTAPIVNSVSLTIGGVAVSATENGNDKYVVSLYGKTDAQMFTAINFSANEQATVNISLMGSPKNVATNSSGQATVLVSTLLGGLDPQGDGVSVKTLKSYLGSDGTGTITATLTDTSGNSRTVTITITES